MGWGSSRGQRNVNDKLAELRAENLNTAQQIREFFKQADASFDKQEIKRKLVIDDPTRAELLGQITRPSLVSDKALSEVTLLSRSIASRTRRGKKIRELTILLYETTATVIMNKARPHSPEFFIGSFMGDEKTDIIMKDYDDDDELEDSTNLDRMGLGGDPKE